MNFSNEVGETRDDKNAKRMREWEKERESFVYSREASVSLKTDVVQLLSIVWENYCVYKYIYRVLYNWGNISLKRITNNLSFWKLYINKC